MTRPALPLIAGLFLTTGSARGQVETSDELVAAVRRGQERLAAAERVYSYRCRFDAHYKRINESSTWERQVLRRGDWVLVETEAPARKADGKARPAGRHRDCVSGDHMFRITWLAGKSAWYLEGFARKDFRAAFHESTEWTEPVVYPLRASPFRGTVEDVFNAPGLAVRAVRPRPDGLVDADLSVVFASEPELTFEGTMTFSPRHDYAVVECDYKILPGGNHHLKYTRTLDESGGPVRCRSIRFTGTAVKTGIVEDTKEYTFTDHTTEAPDEARFTLEYYGLTTPDDDLPPWYSGWVLWVLLAVAAFGLVVLFRRLARRADR